MNPLLSDRFVDYLLFDVLDVESLCTLPSFKEHSRAGTFQPWLDACRRLARDVLYPTYRAMDSEPARFENGEVKLHPVMKQLWPKLVELGVIAAARQLPFTLVNVGTGYLGAGNLSAVGLAGLTSGAAHLIEAFGSDALKGRYLEPMLSGRWTGTMALTEPHAGSSLADLTTRATPAGEHYLLSGAKIFISGGGQDLTENIVHLTLARIDGAEAGTRGISLFVVPKLRPSATKGLEPNDVHVTGLIHKIGWRGLPSVSLALGEDGDCRGWLVGAPGQGLKLMFQMMNEARLVVGLSGIATASVAYHEAVAYARERKQGRPLGADATSKPVALVEHPDVRRMLLRQKAIVEGGLGLVAMASRYADLVEHSTDAAERARCKLLLDLLTPIAKTFPAERGFEANTLALQVHGGYGYSSEFLPEAWLRDQKLNSIHEGTTTIQGLDLLGRKVVAGGGAALLALQQEVEADLATGPPALATPVRAALDRTLELTAVLGARGAEGDLDGMLGHSADYLELMSVLVIAWVWVKLAAKAPAGAFGDGLTRAAEYWVRTEVPRIAELAARCESAERSYLDLSPDSL